MFKLNQLQRNYFKDLRSEENFLDVTLVSTDQVQMYAHKVVLSSSSEFFRAILSQNKHSHPIVCLDGVSSTNLGHLLDYIYSGEISVFHNELDDFLLLTNRFKLDGHLEKVKIEPSSNDPYDLSNDCTIEEVKVVETKDVIDNTEATINMTKIDAEEENDVQETLIDDMPTQQTSLNFEKDESIEHAVRGTPGRKRKDASFIDANVIAKIKSHFDEIMQIGELGGRRCFQCSICHKAIPHTLRRHAMSHVERHIEGLVFPCNFCDKKCRLSDSLRMHMKRTHNQK